MMRSYHSLKASAVPEWWKPTAWLSSGQCSEPFHHTYPTMIRIHRLNTVATPVANYSPRPGIPTQLLTQRPLGSGAGMTCVPLAHRDPRLVLLKGHQNTDDD
jgi:hypothetical protein